MGESEQTTRVIIDDWHVAYKRGNDYDLWGQPIEAIDSYTRLAANMRYESHSEGILFSDEQKKVLKKLAACLELRVKTLHSPDKLESISLDDMKKIEISIQNLLTVQAKEFPIEVNTRNTELNSQLSTNSSELNCQLSSTSSEPTTSEMSSQNSKVSIERKVCDEDIADTRLLGSLLAAPVVDPQQTIITIRVEKIGLRDAAQYIDSFLTISLKDNCGGDLSVIQDLPVSHTKDENNVYFNLDVHIQKSLEQLPQDVGIFFEFKHYKPKKSYISTKCWTFLERDEIREGPAVLELYKKPTNFRRKKINLLTSKPLYLHIKIIFNG